MWDILCVSGTSHKLNESTIIVMCISNNTNKENSHTLMEPNSVGIQLRSFMK